MSEKCSVIVLNYNGKQFLEECLNSLKWQSYGDYKVYVVDNASSDGSREFLRNNFPWVCVIEASENFGTAEGSNIGVRNTQGEYVVLMSNDIRADKYCIENLVKTMEDDLRVGICSCKLLEYEPEPITGKYLIDNAGGIIDKFVFPLMLRSGEVNNEKESGIEEVFFSCGGGFIISRGLFNKVGGFDYKYFTLSDDVDLSWRVRLSGYKVVVNHSAIIYHKISATLGPLFSKSQKRFWSERNSLRTILKNYELYTLTVVLPQYLCLLLMEAGFYLLVGRPDLFLSLVKAVTWNILNLVGTLRKRKEVQSFRMVKDKYLLDKMYQGSIKIDTILNNLKLKRCPA